MPKQPGPRVLVATDFSKGGDEAIRQADRWAKETSSALIACHIIPYYLRSAPYFTLAQRRDRDALLDLEKEAAEALSERVRALTHRKADEVGIYIDSGAPDAAILKAAEQLKASLVVVGAHGMTAIPRLMLGNVAERVASYARVPVLLARESAESGTILAATDLSEASLPVLSVGGEIAKQRGAKLIALHVLDLQAVPGAWLGPGPLSAKAWERERGAAEKELTSAMRAAGVTGEAKVIEGMAAREIVMEADRLAAELLVVATHGRTGLARLAIGSVASQVVARAHASVLVLRS